MKKVISLFLLLFLFAIQLTAQEFHRYKGDRKIIYDVSPDRVIVKYRSGITNETRESTLKDDSDVKSFKPLFYHPEMSVPYEVELDKASTAAVKSFMAKLKLDTNVEYVSPILLDSSERKIGAMTNDFIVRLKPGNNVGQISNLLMRYDVKIKERYEYDDRTFILTSESKRNNTLELSRIFFESEMFEWSEPDFLLFVEETTADTHYSQQWSLNNTTGMHSGYSDADIDAAEAWSITAGCSSIRIAILDDGIDLNHPDLSPNLLAGYDATGNNTGGNILYTTDRHGTACAGIAVAAANNNLGVAGVAYNCKLVPVRVRSGTWATTSDFAEAIDWAKYNADVISISINARTDETLINDAIYRAYTLGRGGKGCVLVVAAGNNNSSTIEIPAKNEYVVAVGATNTCDRRKTPTTCSSCGGEDWGSNYGTGLDIVAPGVKIYSTDLRGSIGYTTGDYTPSFNGTSAAAPMTAGVIALILSVNPNLTATEARAVLERNTDKNTNYSFSNATGQPNGSWNNEMGYGRVNAYKALSAMFSISGPEVLCSSGTNYSVSGVPYTTASWTGYNVTPSSGSGLTATVSPNGMGAGWIEWTIINSGCNNPIKVRKNIYVRDYIEGTYTTNSGSTKPLMSVNSVVAGTTTVKLSYPGMNSYNWVKTSGPAIYYSVYSSGKEARIDLSSGQSVTFRVSATGPCGTSISRDLTFSVSGGWGFAVSPNPTSNTLTIEEISIGQDDSRLRGGVENRAYRNVFVKLYNKHQQVVSSGKLEDGMLILNVSTLPTDMYYLHINDGKDITFQRIAINR